jgi:hypothetical protein
MVEKARDPNLLDRQRYCELIRIELLSLVYSQVVHCEYEVKSVFMAVTAEYRRERNKDIVCFKVWCSRNAANVDLSVVQNDRDHALLSGSRMKQSQ